MSKTIPLQPPAPGEAPGEDASGRPFWRSLEDRAQVDALEERLFREFPSSAVHFDATDAVSRRSFLQLLGASAALAGLGACTREPREKILPYSRSPGALTPGNPLHYATAMTLSGVASGLLVTSREGRPVKVEGNPEHPACLGASGLFEQAMLLSLYDPQRARTLLHHGKAIARRDLLIALNALAQKAEADGGATLRFLLEPTSSPLLLELRRRLQERFPKTRFVTFDATVSDGEREGTRLFFGRELTPRYLLEQAKVVVSLDADFLAATPMNLPLIRGFCGRRTPGPEMNRLYVVEPTLTVTGGFADHRVRARPSEVQRFAVALHARLTGKKAEALDPEQEKVLAALVKDLQANRGHAVVIPGARQPALVHAAAHAINVALGALEQTVTFSPAPQGEHGHAALKGLAAEIGRKAVSTLVITARNVAYAAPADLGLAAALRTVPDAIYAAPYEDETSQATNSFLPLAHELESWGDARSADGTVTLQQPLIEPLFGGFTEIEILSAFLGEGERSPSSQLRALWQKRLGGADHELAFDRILSRGFEETKPAGAHEELTPDTDALAEAIAKAGAAPAGVELNVVPDYKVWDGRFANNAWLQELPDPITKLTWGNAALLSKATADRLGVALHDLIELEVRGQRLTAPVYLQPGHADDTVTLAMGYGRQGTELLAAGVGVNASLIRFGDAPFLVSGVTLKKVEGTHRLAITQEHWSVQGRDLALETTLAKLPALEEKAAGLRGVPLTLIEPVKYEGEKWAMAIDLNRCTGCSACMVACQAENNVPVVGKDNVAKNREMQWLRIDRYYAGPEEAPAMITEPMLCQHCETAPCEYVCPVNATVHSDEGLNEMVYNRCVGTRYCSNNCPYKVRRFNFLDYTGGKSPVEKMAMNPDVTVRSRGVMEKCTFCVQRIERVRIDRRVDGKPIEDGAVRTACQQACPTSAITFGSLRDAEAMVAKLHRDPRRFDVLHELGTRPRVGYLARVKNPHEDLA